MALWLIVVYQAHSHKRSPTPKTPNLPLDITANLPSPYPWLKLMLTSTLNQFSIKQACEVRTGQKGLTKIEVQVHTHKRGKRLYESTLLSQVIEMRFYFKNKTPTSNTSTQKHLGWIFYFIFNILDIWWHIFFILSKKCSAY